jgi:hypothetical protein
MYCTLYIGGAASICASYEHICRLAQYITVQYLTLSLLSSYMLLCDTSGLQREQACDELMEASLQACQPPATDVRRYVLVRSTVTVLYTSANVLTNF